MKGHLASERVRGRERRSKVGNEEYMGRMRVRERETAACWEVRLYSLAFSSKPCSCIIFISLFWFDITEGTLIKTHLLFGSSPIVV